MLTAICEDLSHTLSGYILPYTSTIEGTRLEVVCLTEINGLQRENITTVNVVCTHEGNWDPNPIYVCKNSSALGNDIYYAYMTIMLLHKEWGLHRRPHA